MHVTEIVPAGTEVTVGGVTLTLRKPTIAEESAFAAWVKDRVKREAATPDPKAPPDVAERQADRLTRQALLLIGEGYYEPPDGPGYTAAALRPDGMAELLYLTLKTDHPKVTREQVRVLIEDGLARAWARVCELEKLDPLAVAAALQLLGLPADYLSSSATSPTASSTSPTAGSSGKSADSTPTS
jgi:hypothetical protein